MRITGGTMRGRLLAGKVGTGVRPTTSRVREALFSMVGQDLGGWTVLDAFGGSGLLGFEALSRGADSVTVCERHRGHARQIKSSAAALGATIELRVSDASAVLASGSWDLVLLDPPYDLDPVEWAKKAAVATRAVLVVEHRPGVVWPDQIGPLVCDTVRRHGDSALAIFRVGSVSSPSEANEVSDDLGMVEDDGAG